MLRDTSMMANGLIIRSMEKVHKELIIGVFYYSNGQKYIGEWKNGKMIKGNIYPYYREIIFH